MSHKPTGLALLVIALASIFATAAFAQREVVEAGQLFLADNGGIYPSKLPRHESAPIAARLMGEIGTRDGSHPPALRSLEIDVDRTIGIDAAGVPVCRAGEIQSRTSTAARRACGDALLGSGTAEVEVAFPEQTPLSSVGPILLFNGGVHGKTTTVLLHAYVDVPAPTAIVTKATVTRIHQGRFGLRISAHVPEIAGGAGSVTRFELKIRRRFAYRGQKKSFLFASCPTGLWVTKGRVRFADGSSLGVFHPFACTPLS
jgi:hypothetical protein